MHAIDHAGKGLWRAHVGVYSGAKPALPIAATADLLLLDTRTTPQQSPRLVALELHGKHEPRFATARVSLLRLYGD